MMVIMDEGDELLVSDKDVLHDVCVYVVVSGLLIDCIGRLLSSSPLPAILSWFHPHLMMQLKVGQLLVMHSTL